MTKPLGAIRKTALMLAILLAGTAPAQDCIDYSEYIHWAADMGAHPYCVTFAGDFAYACFGNSLGVFDISDPQGPRLVGATGLACCPNDIAIAGDVALVAISNLGYAKLSIVDVANPADPRTIGILDLEAGATSVTASGNFTYVMSGYLFGGDVLQVIDMTDLADPQLVDCITMPDGTGVRYGGLAMLDERILAAGGDPGLLVIDIVEWSSSPPIAVYETPGYCLDVAVAGSLVLVADADFGLGVFDFASDSEPTHLGGIDTPGLAWCVDVFGDHAYVADENYGLQVIDVADPAKPQIVGNYRAPESLFHVAAWDDHAYVVYDERMHVVDATGPTNIPGPKQVLDPVSARSVAISDGHAYVADGVNGLLVIDIWEYSTRDLHVVGNIDTPGSAVDVEVSGNFAYVADYDAGLRIVDLSAGPESPVLRGYIGAVREVRTVAVSGDLVFIGDSENSVGNSLVRVADVSNPDQPVIIGITPTPGSVRDIVVSGEYAYVADRHRGLQVIDISDPTHPLIVGNVETTCPGLSGRARGVSVVGDLAYVAEGSCGMRVVDVSDPENPWVIGRVGTPGTGRGICVLGDHAYLADGTAGLFVIDVSDPENPWITGGVSTSASANGVTTSGSQVYVANGENGLKILPVQCPSFVENRTDSGPFVANADIPIAGLQFAVRPNPFNPRTTISFLLDRAQRAKIGVYEVTGKQVAVLADQTFTDGEHALLWNGRDAAGRTMPSGTYFVRLETESAVRSQKLTLVR